MFSSNPHDPGRFDFALYLVRRDGTGLKRFTYVESCAAFPMCSRDGRRLAFCSNRGAAAPREYNVFIADWIDWLHRSCVAAGPRSILSRGARPRSGGPERRRPPADRRRPAEHGRGRVSPERTSGHACGFPGHAGPHRLPGPRGLRARLSTLEPEEGRPCHHAAEMAGILREVWGEHKEPLVF